MKKRSPIVRDLRTPKYRKRVVADRKKKQNKSVCRKMMDEIWATYHQSLQRKDN